MRSSLKAIVIVAAASLALAAPAGAKTYEVTKRADPTPGTCKKKDCSLREAIIAANARDGSDRIVLPERKAYNLSIPNSIPPGEDDAAEGDLDVTDGLLVTHPGKGRAKVDANGIDRVFSLLAGGPTTFKKLVIRGGDEPSGPDGWGGGIRAEADVVLKRTNVVRNRTVDEDGGGIAFPDEDASLVMRRSALKNNFSGDDGGGFSFDDGGSGTLFIDRSKITGNISSDFGGGFISDASGTIRRTTVSGNRALDGWAGGGDFEGADTPVIIDSTFSGNTTGPSSNGGGLVIDDVVQATLTNVTLAGNQATQAGGGLYVIGAAAALNAVTVTSNTAEFGGGLYSQTTDPFEVSNSLIALNTATDAGADCTDDGGPASAFNIDSLGHNLIGDDSDCNDAFDATGDFVNPNPKLGQLKNNGGPTQTVALKKGSPAINAADKGSAPKKDQRGEKRGKKPDIGAYERVKKKRKKRR